MRTVYLTGLQLENLYRLDVKSYAEKNPDKVRHFKCLDSFKETCNNIIGSGTFFRLDW